MPATCMSTESLQNIGVGLFGTGKRLSMGILVLPKYVFGIHYSILFLPEILLINRPPQQLRQLRCLLFSFLLGSD